jgi:pimeloyl-ACP methyl ester carboxylesterase
MKPGISTRLTALCLITGTLILAPAQTEYVRRQYLDELLHLLPKSDLWEQWLNKTGELPPDFSQLPSIPGLPDPLRMPNGKEVQSLKDWRAWRLELLRLFQYYVTGTPPAAPGNVRLADLSSQTQAGMTVQTVLLEFGPGHRARLSLELIVPGGTGPFPVFLTQDNHRAWALVAASRGYLGCVYAGADSRDDTGAYTNVWPECDWTKLTRRAWAASRCIDYLHTLPMVDRQRIALTGHSRNGKTALIAAAMDERIKAVILSSAGAGGSCSYRFFSEVQFGEGIELITRSFPDWLHPRLRFFSGRENKLPIDQSGLVACVAPRPCLISTAWNDPVESVWAIEQTYYSAQHAYRLLNAPQALQLRYRQGGHEIQAEDIEAYMDWLEVQFRRNTNAVASRPIYPTYADWLRLSRESIHPMEYPSAGLTGLLTTTGGNPVLTPAQWQAKRMEIRRRIEWGLGESPAIENGAMATSEAEPSHRAELLRRNYSPLGVVKTNLVFGNAVCGDLYYPEGAADSKQKIPVIIWVHPVSNSSGYVAGYRRGEAVHLALARAGFAVFCFDQIGHGSRLQEISRFYERYPHWSLLGKTVADLQASLQAMAQVPFADVRRIFLLGYSTGAMAALHAAALDERIAGVISVAGFTPLRLDTVDKGTGGVLRWSYWMPLQPRLGAFVGNEDRIPYDYHEVLAMIAPRPVLVVQPRLDYHVNRADVKICLQEVQRVYQMLQAPDKLAWLDVDDYNHWSPQLQEQVIAQIQLLAK